jgi:cell division protein FtsL
VGVLLAGIVAMRVEVLKLGVSVGRSTALASQLESENQTLRANVASLSNAARIEHLAATMGMAMPGPLDLHFISASGARDLGRAAAGIASPDPTTFESGLATQNAVHSASMNAVAPSPAVPSGASSSSVPPAASGASSSSVPPATGAGGPGPTSTANGAPLG